MFRFEIRNLIADRASPFPELVFGTNLSEDGTTVTDASTVEDEISQRVEVFPQVGGQDCFFAFAFTPRGVTIPADDAYSLTISVSDVPDPPPAGITLLIRLFMPDGSRIDLVAADLVAGQ